MIEVSVIIPNLNGINFLPGCLDSLRRQTFKNFEIILIDNGSEDGSVLLLEEVYPEVHVTSLDRNYGFCHAVNLGIRKSEAPYVILLNNDIEADENFIKEMLGGIKKHPECFSCASKMVQMYDKSKIDSAGDYYCVLGWAFALGKDKPVREYEDSREIFASCAGAAIYRKEVFGEIGYLDEKHFAYLEDVDIGYRARIFGYRNHYLPKAVVYHAGSGTSGSRHNEFKVRYSSRNNVYLIYKNMPLLQIIINIPFLAAGFLMKLVYFLGKGYGKAYIRGLMKGILMSVHGSKVVFEKAHMMNYVKIQWELWKNTFILPGR